jgi:hypothetical protein
MNYILIKYLLYVHVGSRENSVCLATAYGLDSRGSIPGRGKKSNPQRADRPLAHPDFYTMGSGGSFLRE